jgi:hypothetical protein
MFLAGAVATPAFAAKKKGANRLVDTEEYKEDDFEKGIIEDYSDMVEGDGVEWVYLAPGVKLSDYKLDVGTIKNKSEIGAKSMINALKDALEEGSEHRLSGKKGALKAETAIYWAERSSEGKRWIPYAGFHLAQAGIGVEMILRSSSGDVVAKIRTSSREGDRLEGAAEEVADDILSYMEDN